MNDAPLYLRAALDKLPKDAIKPGTVFMINVRHDSWCTKLKDGPCICRPEIEVTEAGKR